MKAQIDLENIIWPDDNATGRMLRPRFKTRFEIGPNEKTNPVSTWIDTKSRQVENENDEEITTLVAGLNQEATKEVRDLFGGQLLEYPKPVSLIKALCALASRGDDIVVDFFAGSGTTGHAVWDLNDDDGGNRRFVLVQLPEPTERLDYRTISAITAERLRRVGSAIRIANPLLARDTGFRVFKLDSSNFRAWRPQTSDVEQLLINSVDHIEPGRDEQDLLFELLLKLELDLSIHIENRTIATKTVYGVDAGALITCFAKSISSAEVEPLALGIVDWHAALAPIDDTVIVLRDSAFHDDVAKANLTAILGQHGLSNVRSI